MTKRINDPPHPSEIIRRGWKLVAVRYGIYWSYVVNVEYAKVMYRPNKWVEPKPECGPLSVFTERHFAEKFQAGTEHSEILSCEYRPAGVANDVLYTSARGTYRQLCECPEGTVLAYAVKVLKGDEA